MNNHFAEPGDVWKHLPLAEILRVNPPRHYWETHAGSASYALTVSPSRLHGSLRFLSCAPGDPDLQGCAYLHALQASPGSYPGSPSLALQALGQNATYLFCDIDPESASTLRAATAGFDARVIEAKGYRLSTMSRSLCASSQETCSFISILSTRTSASRPKVRRRSKSPHGWRRPATGSPTGTDMTLSSGAVGRTTRSPDSPRASICGVETRSCQLVSFTPEGLAPGVVVLCWQI